MSRSNSTNNKNEETTPLLSNLSPLQKNQVAGKALANDPAINVYYNSKTNNNAPTKLKRNDTLNSEGDDDSNKDDTGTMLIVAFLLMLLFQLGNRIFSRLQTFPMHNYPLFMNMLSTFIYVPICFIYIIPTIQYGSAITKDQREIPKHKFAIMGFYDSVAGIMQTFAVNYITNSSTIVLVQQSAIPISMMISKIALNSVYTSAQYIGAAVVMMGIIVVLLPTLFSKGDQSSTDNTLEINKYIELGWILVLVVSCVPMCLSSVYKEKALGETEIDVIYMNGWVAVFQSLIAIPLCFPSAAVISMPMDGILPNMYGGWMCWFGINTITESNNPQYLPLDECSSAPFFVTAYLLFNIIYNYLIVVILKFGSANILWMASTVIVPLSNIIFSLKFVPGNKPLTIFDLFGLIVIMFGLVIYRFNVQLLEAWNALIGTKMEEENVEEKRKSRRILKRAESKQVKFVGLNQIEALQTLLDTRVQREQRKAIGRTKEQIRGKYFYQLGIPPSPQVALGEGGPRLSFIEKGGGGGMYHSPTLPGGAVNGNTATSRFLTGAAANRKDTKYNSGGYEQLNKKKMIVRLPVERTYLYSDLY